MIKKLFVCLVCGPALFMPCKIRILYAEAVAWVVQFFYYIYYSAMKKILTEIQNGKK